MPFLEVFHDSHHYTCYGFVFLRGKMEFNLQFSYDFTYFCGSVFTNSWLQFIGKDQKFTLCFDQRCEHIANRNCSVIWGFYGDNGCRCLTQCDIPKEEVRRLEEIRLLLVGLV